MNWSNIVTIGCVSIAAFIEAWQQATKDLPDASHIPRLQGVWNYIPLTLLVIGGVVWVIGLIRRRNTKIDPRAKDSALSEFQDKMKKELEPDPDLAPTREKLRQCEEEKRKLQEQSAPLSSLIPDGRLQIISAHYGVDGGPNADVAEAYLKPKVCGHSLAGWVGADLFGGFQPVIGLAKRVKIRYSFDGTEGTISKKEHELLVLPDPSLVELPRIVVTGLEENDPRIVPSFVDGRKHPIPDFVSFELKNRGGRDAQWVRLNPIKLQKRIAFFEGIAESIAPTDFRNFYADVENQGGIDGNRDLIKAMNEDWASRPNRDTLRELAFPARIDYEDSVGTRFECNFTLIYHGGRGYNQPVDFKCIECRDIYWRRIPKFVEAH